MRSSLSSLLLLSCLSACGAKPEPAVEPAAPAPLDLAVVSVAGKAALSPPSRPLGRTLRLTATTTGELYLLDCENHRLLRYGASGELLGEAGGLGAGTGQFNSPVDLDADGQTVWILDRQNRRLVRLNRVLNFVEQISIEPASDDISAPLWYDGVSASANGDVFLLDRRAPQAVRISAAGEILASYGGFGTGNGRLEAPVDLDAAQDGSLFVLDGRRLLVFDRSGNVQREVQYSEPLARVEAGTKDAWVTTARGELLRFSEGRFLKVTAVTESLPRAVDLSLVAGRDPALLDAGSSVWLCRVASD
jgi:hypothetical protein